MPNNDCPNCKGTGYYGECPECSGTGVADERHRGCPTCEGTGTIPAPPAEPYEPTSGIIGCATISGVDYELLPTVIVQDGGSGHKQYVMLGKQIPAAKASPRENSHVAAARVATPPGVSGELSAGGYSGATSDAGRKQCFTPGYARNPGASRMVCSLTIVQTLKLYAKFAEQTRYTSFVSFLMDFGYSRERANEMHDWIEKHSPKEQTDAG